MRKLHRSGVFDGRGVRLYLNGRLAAEAAAPAGAERLRSGGALTIGAQPAWAAAPWLIDDVRLYGVALGPAPIARLASPGDGCIASGPRPGEPAC